MESTLLADAEIFSEVLEGGTGSFDPDAARAVLRLRFSDGQQQRMLELADRHNRGDLHAEEVEELAAFRRVGNLLALLQGKARLALRNSGTTPR
jgi:hypothetical protein